MTETILLDLGTRDYQEVWDLQEQYFAESIQIKVDNKRNLSNHVPKNRLLLLEHPHVYTLGKAGKRDHLLLDESGLQKVQAQFYPINRGGDITYHGPGQLVAYPLLDLEQFQPSLNIFVQNLEKIVINICAHYGIEGQSFPGYTGVWVDPGLIGKERKICAIGLKSSRWCTMHGLAFNVNTDLTYFKNMIPCGIADKDVTSVEKEIGRKVNIQEIKELFQLEFEKIFHTHLV
jgi:lipoyl(octanoyl) transferase